VKFSKDSSKQGSVKDAASAKMIGGDGIEDSE